MNNRWKIGELVMAWNVEQKAFWNGMIEKIDTSLSIRAFSNGKLYKFNLDGSAIDPVGRTNQRVFSIKHLNEVIYPEYIYEDKL